MMDYDKLIEQLNAWNEQHLSVVCGSKHFACDYLCENEDCIVVRAATALSTLRAENEKLRAELEQVKAERDAAVEDLRKHRKYKCDCCYYADKQSRFPCTECQSPISTYGDGWKWRGQKED